MTEAEVIQIMRGHLESHFPKVCPSCQRNFPNLRDYLLVTKPLGSAIPYDAELADWNPLEPIGTVALANCACGTTLTLSSDGMPLRQLWSLLNWARVETKRRGLSPRELLNYLRDEISEQVLAESEDADGPGRQP